MRSTRSKAATRLSRARAGLARRIARSRRGAGGARRAHGAAAGGHRDLRRRARGATREDPSRAGATRHPGGPRSRPEDPRMARNDGWATPQTFTPPALPGVWQPTPPAFAAAGFVQAGDAKPFGLPTPYYYLPRRPPSLNSQEYADAVNEIKAIGGVDQHRAHGGADAAGAALGQRRLQDTLGRRVEPGHALPGARPQALADRIRAAVRARERHHAGRRADRAGQQVRLPALAPGACHPARR